MCSCVPCAKESSDDRQPEQRNPNVREKEKETESVRLLTEGDDHLSRMPSEWEANSDIMTGNARRNCRDDDRCNGQKTPFEGSAHSGLTPALTRAG